MSLSTWLFGKKKSPTSPLPESSDITYLQESEEFVIIERKTNPLDPSGDNNSSMYPQLPYSLGPGQQQRGAPNLPPSLQHANSLDSSTYQSMMRGVPFKLSPELANDSDEGLREITGRANDLLFRISQINLQSFDYNFLLENSVVLESY